MDSVCLALVGNPNSGKTSIFNLLSGLRSKTGNFPGVTVDRKVTRLKYKNRNVKLVDLPGTYSLYPLTADEQVVNHVLLDPDDQDHPDAIVYVADISQLERHLLLYTQIKDLGYPVFLIINMMDLADAKGIEVKKNNLALLNAERVVLVSREDQESYRLLKRELETFSKDILQDNRYKPIYELNDLEKSIIAKIDFPEKYTELQPYGKLQIVQRAEYLEFLPKDFQKQILELREELNFIPLNHQVEETLQRYSQLEPTLARVLKVGSTSFRKWSIDNFLTHRIIGPFIFVLINIFIFQAIYAWAELPMTWIENSFSFLGEQVANNNLPQWLKDLLANGILPGVAGVLVFIPQIAILFFFIGILEETGYMARVVFMFDRLMQRFGLNGRSIVALISGGACAIPAIMSTRSIKSSKERLITILVTPFISCSARTPVFVVLIAFAVPYKPIWGIFNLQGLAFTSLYFLGIFAAFISAWILKKVLKVSEASYLMLEIPEYRLPKLKNLLFYTYEKAKSFVTEAGKIILFIAMLLWLMASYGPGKRVAAAIEVAQQKIEQEQLSQEQAQQIIANVRLENSYAGILGKSIEPVIQPLGFDWKIGIALITSFAAREVFVATMATLYNLGGEEDEYRIRELLAKQINPETGEKVYTQGTSWALILFYVFALQCMSTMAVVKKETGSWKWPIIQFIGMGLLAYGAALLAYQIIS